MGKSREFMQMAKKKLSFIMELSEKFMLMVIQLYILQIMTLNKHYQMVALSTILLKRIQLKRLFQMGQM